MSSSNPRPKWWQLYLTFPLLIALFMADARLKISTRGHQTIPIGILLLVYGLIYMWLKSNAAALARMDHQENYRRITVIHVPISHGFDADQHVFELPQVEIKGVLSDTFEIEYIDMEAIPVEDASQEPDKE